MAVHCVPVPDDQLLESVESGERLLIVGCPICASICCALQNQEPIWQVGGKGINARAIRHEVERLATLFRQRGVHVTTYVRRLPLSVCLTDNWGRKALQRRSQHCDRILVMACEVGQKNLIAMLGPEKIIGGMHAQGLLRMQIEISGRRLGIRAIPGSGEAWRPD